MYDVLMCIVYVHFLYVSSGASAADAPHCSDERSLHRLRNANPRSKGKNLWCHTSQSSAVRKYIEETLCHMERRSMYVPDQMLSAVCLDFGLIT